MDYHKVASDKEQAAIKALTAGIDVELPTFDCYKEPLKRQLNQESYQLLLLTTLLKIFLD